MVGVSFRGPQQSCSSCRDLSDSMTGRAFDIQASEHNLAVRVTDAALACAGKSGAAAVIKDLGNTNPSEESAFNHPIVHSNLLKA